MLQSQGWSQGCKLVIGGNSVPPGDDGSDNLGNIVSARQPEVAAGLAAGASKGNRAWAEVMIGGIMAEYDARSEEIPGSATAGERMGGRPIKDCRVCASRDSEEDGSVQDIGEWIGMVSIWLRN